jgi:hypothetical protein
MINSSACCGPAAAVHLQITRRPNAGCPDAEGEDRILNAVTTPTPGTVTGCFIAFCQAAGFVVELSLLLTYV